MSADNRRTVEPFNCRAGRDGDCDWAECPQLRDNEPVRSGRTCPGRWWSDDPEY